MIPAHILCPDTWTLEYSGYLMSEHYTHHRSLAVCMDKDAETVSGEAANTDGVVFYNTEVTCNGLCPPYVTEKELACAVCTK